MSLDISCELSAKQTIHLADGSHGISRIVFFEKLRKKYFRMPSAAVVIGALRVKKCSNIFFSVRFVFKPLDAGNAYG